MTYSPLPVPERPVPAELDAAMRVAQDRSAPWDERIKAIERARYELDRFVYQLVAWCRNDGQTWAEIGHALGVSKQAAQQRFGSRAPA